MHKIKLDKKVTKCIHDWLVTNPRIRWRKCPFTPLSYRCDICNELFPKCGEFCPCVMYSKGYVYKKAKKIVEQQKET